MAYKTVSGAQSAEIELDGSVYTVNFGHSYKYYAVRNDGSGTIYVSTTDKSCTPKNDGVVSIPSGGSYVHCNGYGGNSEIYFSGSGGAVVIAQDDPNNPFKAARKGGDGGGILPYSEGIIGYFDMSTFDAINKIWHNKMDKFPDFTFTNVSLEQDAVSIATREYGTITALPEPQTIYIIFKSKTKTNNFNGIISKSLDSNNLNYVKDIYVYQKNVFFCASGSTDVPAIDDFHLVTLTNNQGIESKGYIDGDLHYNYPSIDWGTYQGDYYLNHMHRGTTDETYDGEYIKLIIFDLHYHTPEQVAKNSQYIMQKYFNY